MNQDIFHEGERAIQARLGLGDRVQRFAAQMVRSYMPEQHRAFYEQLPFLVMAARDLQERPWVTLLTGAPGFMRAGTDTTLDVQAALHPGDPLAAALDAGAAVGLLGIELDSRRRNRFNGVMRKAPDGTLQIQSQQTFGNCPQYISQRDWKPAPASRPASIATESASLTAAHRQWIAAADTFFIGSGYQTPEASAASGMDASHRGGPAGFVEVVDQNTLVFPDYAGNNHFNTLGNLVQDPRVALLFVDFEHGHLLHITGTAHIDWDSAAVAQTPGAQRLVQVHIDSVIEQRNALAIRWQTSAAEPLRLRVAERVRESDAITSFVLENTAAAPLPDFTPGQHLPIAIDTAGTVQRRTYSLSAAPDPNRYRISVKRESQGLVSQALHQQLQVGDHLRAGSPAGEFKLLDSPAPVTLISAGVGITPMLSMLQQLRNSDSKRPVLFMHGARNGSQQAFADEIGALTEGCDWIQTRLLLSQPNDADQIGLNYHAQGHVSAQAIADLHPALDGEFYLCGPAAMLEAVLSGLRALGVDDHRVHFESF